MEELYALLATILRHQEARKTAPLKTEIKGTNNFKKKNTNQPKILNLFSLILSRFPPSFLTSPPVLLSY